MKITTVKRIDGFDGWLVNGTYYVPDAKGNSYQRRVLQWIAAGGLVSPADPPPAEPTVEEQIAQLPPLWRATLEAYIEQHPRNKAAVIANIKRHMR